MTHVLLIKDIHFNNSTEVKVDGRLPLQILVKEGVRYGDISDSVLVMW
jgi:hypothetical protein